MTNPAKKLSREEGRQSASKPNEPPETKAVTMRLRVSTIAAVDWLQDFFETSNRTEVVARSVRLAQSIGKEVMEGGTIEVRRKDGTVAQLMFQ